MSGCDGLLQLALCAKTAMRSLVCGTWISCGPLWKTVRYKLCKQSRSKILEWLSGPAAAAWVVTNVLDEMRDGGETSRGCLSWCANCILAGFVCGGVVI